MNFWTGLIIGLILGANIGVVVAGLLASVKREEHSMAGMDMHHPHESAVMKGDSECSGSHRDPGRTSKSNGTGPQGTP
jgi:hypothetical protein